MTSRRNLPITRADSAVVCPGAGHVDRVVAEVRHLQVAEQQAAVGVRVVAHPAVPLRGQLGQLGT